MMPEHFLKLFNTKTREKEPIHPIDGKLVRIYTCGPTVYDFAHIGNFRTYVFEDLLKRVLLYFGYRVKQVMNITDVDDKTIKGAMQKDVSLAAFTKPYKQAFFQDLKRLHILPAEHYPEATQYFDQMIAIIEDLLKKKIAYKAQDGSIYFSIKAFPSYGCLSHLKLDELKEGASKRGSLDEYDKDSVSDFVLWKSYDPKRDGKIFWDSPFGPGRPGWHIECSAMALALLGNQIDIHCGGVDNIFPHHENEIAQSEAHTNETFVAIWAHAKHLIVENKKMSKSLGNFYTLRDLLDKGYSGIEIRLMLLQSHYRMQLNFTFEELSVIKKTVLRLKDFVKRIKEIRNESKEDISSHIESCRSSIIQALSDDLNISVALASLYEFVRQINQLCDLEKIGVNQAHAVISFFEELDQVFGFLPLKDEKLSIPQEILQAIEDRQIARKEKNWQKADQLRDWIISQGYLLEDTKQGINVKKCRRV